MAKADVATITAWGPWEPLGWYYATTCLISGFKVRMEWDAKGGYQSRCERFFTKPHQNLEEATKALEKAVYRYLTKQERHLSEMRQAMKAGIAMPTPPDAAVMTEQE
jgi:hypothetical protein